MMTDLNSHLNLNEPIAVEARFGEDGKITPRSFVWKGHTYHITDVGRSRIEIKAQHRLYYCLVMVPVRGTFELCLDASDLRWRITRIWERPLAV